VSQSIYLRFIVVDTGGAPEALAQIPTIRAALNDLLAWSADRPAWQRDALRRLMLQGELTADDIDELYAICTGKTEGVPLDVSHIAPVASAGNPVRLLTIADVVGVNALAERQRLEFAPEGLTVVYGDNGSGKSGYVRILKHACRSRDTKFAILPDVNGDPQAPQAATIAFQHGREEASMSWTPAHGRHDVLPAVSIFDSRSANTHLGTSHDVAYSPYAMTLLEQLARACEQVRKKAESDVAALRKQTPAVISSPSLSAFSAARTFLNRLNEESERDELDLLTTLKSDDETRVQTLSADLAAKPTTTIATLTSRKTRLETFLRQVERYELAVGEQVFGEMRGLRERALETADLAKLASAKLFSAAPLPDVGGAQWHALWEAAREYSDQIAYPHQHFPEAKAGEDLCVLCQQPLSTEAVARRMTLEEFVTSTTKVDEQRAAQALSAALDTARGAAVSLQALREGIVLVTDEVGDGPLASNLRASVLTSTARLRALVAERDAPACPNHYPADAAASVVDVLAARIKALAADENSETRRKLATELNGLQDRIKLRDIKADVLAEIDRRKVAAKLQEAVRSTATNSITAKNKELSNQLVTDALRNRFAREIQKLEVGSVPIELRKEADRTGQSFFKVALVGKPNEPVGNILSEGEHRCVALAAFLAELVTSREYSGIVFDDPMSSLDHIYRRKVAKRLVEEAEHRQVVIFTHDLAFLFEINREADLQHQTVSYQTVRRGDDHPGMIEEGLPMKAREAMPRANAVRSHLKAVKGSFDQMKEIERSTMAKGVIAQLRETWEQGIADFLHPVMARFDSRVKPSSMHKLLVLKPEDVDAVVAARRRLSEDSHANPETLNPEEVRHADLVRELDILEAWLHDLLGRQKAAA
jgi:energy-coupling factor transporter ATP-binding protein EcfA2